MKNNVLLLFSFSLFLSVQSTAQIDVNSEWTWVSGDNTANQYGVYGTQGVAGIGNQPGARSGYASWIDSEGNFWLMGGNGYDANGASGYLNDIWKYDMAIKKWIWINGDQVINQPGVYGIPGITTSANKPGSRSNAVVWVDTDEKIWVFGGYGYDVNGSLIYLNDLWNYDPETNQWRWMKGDDDDSQSSVYGTKGIESIDNKPGGRWGSNSWVDPDGKFWLYGGHAYSSLTPGALQDDLWKYDPQTNNWTWITGTQHPNAATVYGNYGQGSTTNSPGGRSGALSWPSTDGTFWLMGGRQAEDFLNDLWKYNPSTNEWTWVKGDNYKNPLPAYGIQGTESGDTKPNALQNAAVWTDDQGKLWLMGGYGFTANGWEYLNDIWKYNPVTNNWTWVKGEQKSNDAGSYGTRGIPAPSNIPGTRASSRCWQGVDGHVYLLGGSGYASNGFGLLNDFWKYDPVSNQWTWLNGKSITNAPGEYGTQGLASGNKPGARSDAMVWATADGMVWLFGGDGYAESGTKGLLNDLWKYNPFTNEWTWIKGDKVPDAQGIYGSLGIPASDNKPSARQAAGTWVDRNGHLWMFGGNGPASNGYSYLNDLWKFDPITHNWTWVKGEKSYSAMGILGVPGIYGIMGVSDPLNNPGGRHSSVGWIDDNGKFWIFGGSGINIGPQAALTGLSDLWRYDPESNEWTWINGGTSTYESGIYGTKGLSSAENKPGGRYFSTGWKTPDGKFWLMGGFGRGKSGSVLGFLNDLWKYDPLINEWIWINGDDVPNQKDVYGAQGVHSVENKPGGRVNSSGWIDRDGNLWLFGGQHFSTTSGNSGNDLWKYNLLTNEWTWIKGDASFSITPGVYGTQGIASVSNKPGSRSGATSWSDLEGRFWLMGGTGSSSTNFGLLNDLWSLTPTTNTYYKDADGDGYGNPNERRLATYIPEGYVRDNTDCDDTKAAVNPGASEICRNGIDDNCNGQIDEGCPPVELPKVYIRNTWVIEGQSGLRDAVFVLRLNNRYPLPVSVDYETVDGSARSPEDFISASGTVTFPPNTWQQTITIQVKGDLTREENEIFRVRLKNPVNAELADERAIGVIINDDRRPGVRVDDAWVRESDRRVRVKIRLTGPTEEWVHVLFETKNGTAKAPHDYEAIKHGRLTFRPGETEKWVQIEIKEDNRREPTEYFEFRIKEADNASLDCSWGARPEARVYIVNCSSNNSRMIAGESDADLLLPLEVKVLPNPSTNYFTLNISTSNRNPIRLRVTDISGRLIEDRKLEGGVQRLQIGERWINGTYFMEVRQGDERKVVQLIKLK